VLTAREWHEVSRCRSNLAKPSKDTALTVTIQQSEEEKLQRLWAGDMSADADLPATVVRLPKVYGPGRNADFETVHLYRLLRPIQELHTFCCTFTRCDARLLCPCGHDLRSWARSLVR
jgi:hypothetical protein